MQEVLPYEDAAMNGFDLPESASSDEDRLCFYGLAFLYRLYTSKIVSKEDATKLKKSMLFELDKIKRSGAFWNRVMAAVHTMRCDTEAALIEYRGIREATLANPTKAGLNKLVEILDRLDYAIAPRLRWDDGNSQSDTDQSGDDGNSQSRAEQDNANPSEAGEGATT